MKLLLILVFISIVGCTSSPYMDIKIAYKNRGEILSTFSNVSVFRKGTGNNVFLHTYKEGKKNEYVFTKNQGRYSLHRESLLFSPDMTLEANRNEQNGAMYKKQLIDKLEFYLRKMDSLKISDISSDFFAQGIDLKIYIKPKGVLVYVPDSNKIVNEEWVKYIKSMQKLDDNWYYTMNE